MEQLIQKKINKKFCEMFVTSDREKDKPLVCLICDEFLKRNDVHLLSLDKLQKSVMFLGKVNYKSCHKDILKHYTFQFKCYNPANNWLQKLILSPRGTYVKSSDGRTTDGFRVCKNCLISMNMNSIPKFAIANNYLFGKPPKCLSDLNQVELALLTPVKTFGYCFSYTGGSQMMLKGSLSFYKVKMESIAKACLHFDATNLSNNVVILLYGKLTKNQYKKAVEKSKIRTKYVLEALDWLIDNNKEWQKMDINMDEVVSKLQNPVIIDNSKEVEGENERIQNNVESTESFQVFFPDGSISSTAAGQNNAEEFARLVELTKSHGIDITLQANFNKTPVKDYCDNNLVNACLLQFPYGIGGIHEPRIKQDGSRTTNTDVVEYVTHLSKISQPQFQYDLFTLILYNMYVKQQMLKSAFWCVRSPAKADLLCKDINEQDIRAAIYKKSRGLLMENELGAGECYIKAIDTITKDVPHTNDAAKKARLNAEAIQHRFGIASWFLTVTPDDDNCYLIQVFSGDIIDDKAKIKNMSDEELEKRAEKRTKLRIQVPGICAYYFEQVIDIVVEEVIGWDTKKGEALQNGGLFGMAEAYIISVEEQGRRTLHAHIQIWIKDFNKTREMIHIGGERDRVAAARNITETFNKVSSCTLFDAELTKKGFPHDCCESDDRIVSRNPVVVDLQNLRNMRCLVEEDATFAYCGVCNKTWTKEEAVELYLKKMKKIDSITHFPDNNTCRRLKSYVVEFQKNACSKTIETCIIDAAYNFHCHCASCFKMKHSTGKKRKLECRYRFPQMKKRRTIIQETDPNGIAWYDWKGNKSLRKIKEIIRARTPLNAFQNICCAPISYSKLGCNTNITPIMFGPISQYLFHYLLKGTQDDDTSEYEEVLKYISKSLSRMERHIPEKSCKKAQKKLLAASFVHQKTNVVGAPMASYLIRNNSRFIQSHTCQWCPLRDIYSLLMNEGASATVEKQGKKPYFVCTALHYLCRPVELENVNVYDFYTKFKVVKGCDSSKCMSFVNSLMFIHGSYNNFSEKFMQSVVERDKPVLLKVLQYDFPDTADFNGCILNDDIEINDETEKYSRQVLLLFKPFRTLSDILGDEEFFTKSLQDSYKSNFLRCCDIEFLQNIQDVRSNCVRITKVEDELQRLTKPPENLDNTIEEELNNMLEEHETENDTNDFVGHHIDEIINSFNTSDDNFPTSNDGCDDSKQFEITFSTIKNKGRHQCGYNDIAKTCVSTCVDNLFTAYDTNDIANRNNKMNDNSDEDVTVSQEPPTSKELVRILIEKCTRRTRICGMNNSEETVDIIEANGSAKSIIDWSEKNKLDRMQRRAFEMFCATFVLSFLRKDMFNEGYDNVFGNDLALLRKEKKKLRQLAEYKKRKSDQIICLMHGPGGSGKTTVIDLVIEYAKEFCSYMETYKFTSRTIAVTAMTGVAATLLMGETTHSVCYLNKRKDDFSAEQIETWQETRMIIIDEISFATKEDITKIERNISALKQNKSIQYGGVSVIFSGDFCQLPPVGNSCKPLYQSYCAQFHDFLNCLIRLRGKHRFKNDPAWGEFLRKFRNGTIKSNDIEEFNRKCVLKRNQELPANIRYATYFNKDRDAINAALFDQYCVDQFEQNGHVNDAMIVFCDCLKIKNSAGNYVQLTNRKGFWENCSEDDVTVSDRASGRMDPVLRLFKGCRVMLPCNEDVKNGRANGTQALMKQIILKSNASPKKISLAVADRHGNVRNIPINAVCASDISKIELEHCNKQIIPSVFNVIPRKYTFRAKMMKPELLRSKQDDQEYIDMKGVQIPLLINNATTGHKLQGASVDNLFIHNWSYKPNWVYVMLSRVRTQKGLFCRFPLSTDVSKYQVPRGLKEMLHKFDSYDVTPWNDNEYQSLLDQQ